MSEKETTGNLIKETEGWSMDWEPVAAEEYDGDHECQYDCENTADWVVEKQASQYTGKKAFLCCHDCNWENKIGILGKGLNHVAVSEEIREDFLE